MLFAFVGLNFVATMVGYLIDSEAISRLVPKWGGQNEKSRSDIFDDRLGDLCIRFGGLGSAPTPANLNFDHHARRVMALMDGQWTTQFSA